MEVVEEMPIILEPWLIAKNIVLLENLSLSLRSILKLFLRGKTTMILAFNPNPQDQMVPMPIFGSIITKMQDDAKYFPMMVTSSQTKIDLNSFISVLVHVKIT